MPRPLPTKKVNEYTSRVLFPRRPTSPEQNLLDVSDNFALVLIDLSFGTDCMKANRLRKFSACKAMFARILTVLCIPLALGLVQWFQFQSPMKVMLVM
jgi:hypothetical protein